MSAQKVKDDAPLDLSTHIEAVAWARGWNECLAALTASPSVGEDTRRLDWLEAHASINSHPTVRAAIDAAMGAGGDKGEGK